jgi:hypothetical protein
VTSNCKHENSASERMVTLTLDQWEAWRKAAGLHIDPETAEVLWDYRQVVDPYGIWPEIPEECDCVGRSGLDFIPFAQRYLEQNFGPISSLSEVEFDQAMKVTYEAYLTEEARLQGEVCRLRKDGAKS